MCDIEIKVVSSRLPNEPTDYHHFIFDNIYNFISLIVQIVFIDQILSKTTKFSIELWWNITALCEIIAVNHSLIWQINKQKKNSAVGEFSIEQKSRRPLQRKCYLYLKDIGKFFWRKIIEFQWTRRNGWLEMCCADT